MAQRLQAGGSITAKDTAEGLLARRLAGEDVAQQGEWQVRNEPIEASNHPDGDVKIGKSLRVPLAMFAEIKAVAQRRRMSWSALVREWIADGLTHDREAGVDVDPVVELHYHLDAAARALRALEGRRDAA